MSVSVRRLLALPEWADTVRVVAGANGLERPVESVRPAEEPTGHAPAPGELVVLVRPIPLDDWRVDALLRRITETRGAAVLLPEEGPGPSRATRLLADRLAVPLLGTETGTVDLLVATRLLLAAPELDRANLLLAVHDALGEGVRSPDEVVGALHEVLRIPVALLDERGDPLAGDLPERGEVSVAEQVPQRTETAGGLLLTHPAPVPRTIRPPLWVAALLQDPSTQRADTVAPALAVAAGAVQRWLLVRRLDLERDARSRTALLGDVLRLDDEPSADLRRRAADAGWRLDGWHVGIRISAPSSMDVVGRRQEVESALVAEGTDPVVVEHGDGWTAWVSFDQEPGAARVRDLATQFRKAHRALQRTADVSMGVGRPHPRAEGLAGTIAEATDAARMAATRPETGHLLHVDQLGMAQLLLEWTRTDTFEPAARALIAPLRGQPGDLVRTLAAYLDAESSISETAAVLGVHRNTVAARVERIERSLAVDLDDRDERLALHLASRAMILGEQA